MKKYEVTLMFGAVMSGWGFDVVKVKKIRDVGVNGDPLPDDEWE